MSSTVAVDIGSTKVDFCRIDDGFGVIDSKQYATITFQPGSLVFMEHLKRHLREWIDGETAAIAISFNCSLHDGVVAWSSVLGGPVDYPIEKELATELRLPVAATDDIHAMTLAEARFGAGVGVGSFAMLNIGTGIGVGSYDGRILSGCKSNAGLIGHNPTLVPELDETRDLDRVVSGRGVSELYERFAGHRLDAREVFSRAGRDAHADRAIAVFARHLGDVLVDINRFYDPELIILNGSVRHAAPLYLDEAWRRYTSLVEPMFRVRAIQVSSLEHAAPLGAALRLSS